jgi:adenylate cyclase
LIGLSEMLAANVVMSFSANPTEDAGRAEALASQVLLAHPEIARAHFAMSSSLWANKQIDGAIAEAEAAIAINPNLAEAYARVGYFKVYLGRAAEGFPGVETALRLSPRDPGRWWWEYNICSLHWHLEQWDQAIEWCRKSIAAQPTTFNYSALAAAYAWTGRDAEARAAVVELLKLKPGYTGQQWMNSVKKLSDNPTYQRELQPVLEGLRKAGLPEG